MDNPSDSGIARLPDQKVPPQSMLWRPAVEVKKMRGRPRRSDQCRGAARSADARRPLHVREVAQQQPPWKTYQIARPVEPQLARPHRLRERHRARPHPDDGGGIGVHDEVDVEVFAWEWDPSGAGITLAWERGILHGGPLNQPAAPLEGQGAAGGARVCGATRGQAGGGSVRSRPQDLRARRQRAREASVPTI
jgi:hypothetical protein